MVKINFTDNQTAFEYAMYMMLGSYFNKETCKNYLLEKKMHTRYLEQKERSQIEMEKLCIQFVEKELFSSLPKDIWEQDVEVKFAPTKWNGVHDIQFRSSNYILRIMSVYRGSKNTLIRYEIWHKVGKSHSKKAV